MGRRLKEHIKDPTNGRQSICGRASVKYAERDSDATCSRCILLVAQGTLERKTFEKNKNKFPGANQTGMPRFTEQQRKFAAHPAVTTNAKQAALDAGYSKTYADKHASALRQQLAPLILEHQETAKKRAAISVAKVQTELASMGFANVIDYFEIDKETGKVLPKKLGDLTREQAAAIQEVEVAEYETLEGTEYRIKKIKLADKRANLVELGKTLGMFNKITIEDKREQTQLMADIPTEALEQAESLLLAAARTAKGERGKRNAVEGEFKELSDVTSEK